MNVARVYLALFWYCGRPSQGLLLWAVLPSLLGLYQHSAQRSDAGNAQAFSCTMSIGDALRITAGMTDKQLCSKTFLFPSSEWQPGSDQSTLNLSTCLQEPFRETSHLVLPAVDWKMRDLLVRRRQGSSTSSVRCSGTFMLMYSCLR